MNFSDDRIAGTARTIGSEDKVRQGRRQHYSWTMLLNTMTELSEGGKKKPSVFLSPGSNMNSGHVSVIRRNRISISSFCFFEFSKCSTTNVYSNQENPYIISGFTEAFCNIGVGGVKWCSCYGNVSWFESEMSYKSLVSSAAAFRGGDCGR